MNVNLFAGKTSVQSAVYRLSRIVDPSVTRESIEALDYASLCVYQTQLTKDVVKAQLVGA